MTTLSITEGIAQNRCDTPLILFRMIVCHDGPRGFLMKQVILMLSFLLLTACAAKKLAVKHADTFLVHAVEKRLPLHSEQKSQLNKDVDKFLMEKKPVAEELLPVIDMIDIDKPAQFDEIYEKLVSSYRKTANDFSQLLAKHIADLSPDQQKKFFKKLSSENKDIKEKKPAERVSDLKRKLEKIMGSVSDKQEALISQQESYLVAKAQMRLERREKLHEKMKDILKEDSTSETKREKLLEAFTQYQKSTIDAAKENLPLIKKFAATMSDKQKEKLRESVSELKQIIGYYLETDY